MATLLLRIAAPLQSWGIDSKFDIRRTEAEPSKSGIIGMIASALGLRRDSEEIKSLSDALRFGVRTDKPGKLLRDYHTVRKGGKTTYVTNRYYLSDAAFLVALESSDEKLLSKIQHALSHPVYPLFLGRRSCPPTLPLCLGIRQAGILESFEKEPLLCEGAEKCRYSIEIREQTSDAYLKKDAPLTFNLLHRQSGYRWVKEGYITGKVAEKVKNFDVQSF